MKITIIGAGYVGLTLGLSLAHHQHQVITIERDENKVLQLQAGNIPFIEPGLIELLDACREKNWHITKNEYHLALNSEVYIIAVDAPFQDNQQDLSAVKEATLLIADLIKESDIFSVVLVKSTVLPGTCDRLIAPLLAKVSGKRDTEAFSVVMNPEFFREGQALKDALFPDRIVIGCQQFRTQQIIQTLYAGFRTPKWIIVNNLTAEWIKYASNALLATLISFSNEIANACSHEEGVDGLEVLQALHFDQRWHSQVNEEKVSSPEILAYLHPGVGYGGHCLPKDVKAIVQHAKNQGGSLPLLHTVDQINEQQPQQILTLIRQFFPNLTNLKIGILGLAFKVGTNDTRYSPAIRLIRELCLEQAIIYAHDPAVQKLSDSSLTDNIYFENELLSLLQKVAVVVIMTAWETYQQLPALMKSLTNPPLVIDGRRYLSKNSLENYIGIGLSGL